MGFAGLTVTVFALLLSVTLLPAVLSFLGRRVDVLRVRPKRPAREAGGSAAWRRWGRRVIARPVLWLVLASAPLVWLARAGAAARHGAAGGRLAAEGFRVGPRVPHARRRWGAGTWCTRYGSC